MSYKYEKPFENALDDKRRKIDPKDHEQIKLDYQDLKSYQKTADKWGVSKKTIIFICQPELYAEFKRKRYLLKPWLEFYDKDKQREAVRDLRRRKRDLFLLNKPKNPCGGCGAVLDPNGKRQKFCSRVCCYTFHNNQKKKKPLV